MTERQQRSRPRSRRLPREVRERQILEAAVQVFAEHGFHSASMDEISEVAGISKPMLYTYLGAKDELFVACVHREAGRLIESIGAAADVDRAPDDQLWWGLRLFFEHVHNNRSGWAILHRQADTGSEPFVAEIVETRHRATELVAGLLAAATDGSARPMRSTQTAPFAAALVGAVESLVQWWFENPEHTADGMALRLMNMVWLGFGNLVEGRSWSPGDRGSVPEEAEPGQSRPDQAPPG